MKLISSAVTSILLINLIISSIYLDNFQKIKKSYFETLYSSYLIVKINISKELFNKFHKMLRALRKSGKIASRAISIANLLIYAKVGGSFRS